MSYRVQCEWCMRNDCKEKGGNIDPCSVLWRWEMTYTQDKLLEACKLALKMLNYTDCIQGCNGSGAIQIHGKEIEKCQWCDEKHKIEQAIAEAEEGVK